MTSVSETWPVKAPVADVPISCTSYEEVLELIAWRPRDRPTTIAVCNVHSVMTARRDRRVAEALAAADIATPDGMPLVWTLRRTVSRNQTRVYGPDLMRRGLAYGRAHRWRHYFLGATNETLIRLRRAAEQIAPGVDVVGQCAPPYGDWSAAEERAIRDDIRRCRPDVVWVGLGMPRQELWMHRTGNHLPGIALIGVGAAFDFLSGTVKQAPAWMQRAGIEWLYRLSQEPRRLWRRYLYNNPAFAWLTVCDLVRHRGGTRFVDVRRG